MKDWCRCCGKLRFVKEHDGVLLCPACVAKVRAGEAPELTKIKQLQSVKLDD